MLLRGEAVPSSSSFLCTSGQILPLFLSEINFIGSFSNPPFALQIMARGSCHSTIQIEIHENVLAKLLNHNVLQLLNGHVQRLVVEE